MHFTTPKSILSANNGMNIYRGCSHGCIYCDSRSRCYGFDHPFEDIEVKSNAPQLLEAALKSRRKRCMIGTGSMCDPYLHAEEKLCLTRECLKLIERYGFGVSILTKSELILRDMELLKAINEKGRCLVQMTMTTYDEKLCTILEPNVSTTKRRFEVLKTMQSAGIPTMVWLSPVLPFINDTEENIMGILEYCAQAGVKGVVCFGMGLTLREGSREYFYSQLEKSFPGMKQRYISAYANSYELTSPNNDRLMSLLRDFCREHGIMYNINECFTYMWKFPEENIQIGLFS